MTEKKNLTLNSIIQLFEYAVFTVKILKKKKNSFMWQKYIDAQFILTSCQQNYGCDIFIERV